MTLVISYLEHSNEGLFLAHTQRNLSGCDDGHSSTLDLVRSVLFLEHIERQIEYTFWQRGPETFPVLIIHMMHLNWPTWWLHYWLCDTDLNLFWNHLQSRPLETMGLVTPRTWAVDRWIKAIEVGPTPHWGGTLLVPSITYSRVGYCYYLTNSYAYSYSY